MNPPPSYSPPQEARLHAWGATLYAYVFDSTDDGNINYDRIAFAFDSKQMLASLREQEWSDWYAVTLPWQERAVASHVMFHVIKMEAQGFSRVRLLFDNLNEFVTWPGTVGQELNAQVGPMIDFADNFPPQLIHYKEDKKRYGKRLSARLPGTPMLSGLLCGNIGRM